MEYAQGVVSHGKTILDRTIHVFDELVYIIKEMGVKYKSEEKFRELWNMRSFLPYGTTNKDTAFYWFCRGVDFEKYENKKIAPKPANPERLECGCSDPDITWNHNHTKWACIFCGVHT